MCRDLDRVAIFTHEPSRIPSSTQSVFNLKHNTNGALLFLTVVASIVGCLLFLGRPRFETAKSPNFYHAHHATEYRVPLSVLKQGEKFRFTLENSRPTRDIRLMIYILNPEPGATLKAGLVTVNGVAYNDGKALIESVLVSVDRGQSWQPAKFDVPDSPYAWYQWKTHATLGRGNHEIWARATDALGRSQPVDSKIFWNSNGHEWTGVFKIEVTVIDVVLPVI